MTSSFFFFSLHLIFVKCQRYLFLPIKLSIIVILLLPYLSLVAEAQRHFTSIPDFHTRAKEVFFPRKKMETKWLCILFVFLILVAFSPGPEAALNARSRRRRRNGRKTFQIAVRPLRVSRFIATCLPYLLTCLHCFKLISRELWHPFRQRFNDFRRVEAKPAGYDKVFI